MPPPGRTARSPATIVRRPLSGSIRRSGTRELSQRVALDVLLELLLARVLALPDVGELARLVVEDGRRERLDRVEDLRDPVVAVLVARVADGVLLEELGGVVVVVVA